MSISTAATSRSKSSRQGPIPTAIFLFLPGIILVPGVFTKRLSKRGLRLGLTSGLLVLGMIFLLSCAGVSNSGGGGGQTTPVTYQVTITGNSPGTPADSGQSAIVTLVVD